MAGRTRSRGAAGALLVLVAGLTMLLGGRVALADQTIDFDGAGDAPHISLIGDSTLTGVRWYADYGDLRRFNFVLSAESCRRTIDRSCISREGYRSANVLSAMQTLDGDLGDVLVVMSGYNDPAGSIDDAIADVVDEARRQGVAHVVWLSLRTSDDVDYSDPQEQSSINTFREYNEQLVAAAASSGGALQIADWATYSNGASAWFERDGVHLTPRGVDALTTFLAATVQQVLAGGDVSPATAPWTVLVPPAEGELVTAVQTALIAAGIDVPGGADGVYGNDTMVAVAEYQRRHDDLQVTGAVDMTTARMLGVFEDPDAVTAPTTTTRGTPIVADPVVTTAPTPATVTADANAGSDGQSPDMLRRWTLVAGLAVIALAVAVVGRRRYVVARRRRRWARVHPATSPHRSVADLRRTGQLPPAPRPGGRIYDRQLEAPSVAETSEAR